MKLITNCIYNFYDNYIYVGVIKHTSPQGYSKMHAIVIASFLFACNLIALKRLLSLSFTTDTVYYGFYILAMIYFLYQYKFVLPELYRIDYTPFVKLLTLAYVVLTFAMLFY